MRTLRFEQGEARLVDAAARPREGEAWVRVLRAGICATDLEICRGYMRFEGVLGHEWVGVVESSPDPGWVGQRVTGEINASCGACATCRRGHGSHCPHRTVLGIAGRDGVFAEHTSLPLSTLHRVPDAVSDEAAVFVEPLAAALEIATQVHVRPTDTIAVLGVGRLGQLCARVLALTGARVVGIGRDRRRLDLLPPPIVRATLDEVAPRSCDIAVDCTGDAAGLQLAASLVRPRGTLVLKSTTHGGVTVDRNAFVIDEIAIVGSRCGPFDAALRLLASGLVDPTPLVTGRFALSDGLAALAAAASPDHLKVLLDPSR